MNEDILRGAEQALSLAVAYKNGRFRRWTPPTPNEIKACRHELHLSQTAFAEIFGFDTTTLRSWEQGKRYPNNEASLLLQLIKHDASALHSLILNATDPTPKKRKREGV